MSRRKTVIWALLALLAIGGGVTWFVMSSTSGAEVDIAEAGRGDLSVAVSASGRVAAGDKVDLYPPTAGTLASIEVTEGQRVVAGQVIARLDTTPLELQLAQAEAAYAGARAQRDAAATAVPGASDRAAADAAVSAAKTALDAAELQYQAALSGAGGPTDAQVAEARTAVAVAEAALTAAQAAYDEFYAGVYEPAPEPKDPSLETALAALTLARDQAAANLATAQQALAALEAASDPAITAAAAKVARDQANVAYLGAVAQRDALAKASSVGSALSAADAAIEAAAAARDAAEQAIEDSTLTAPADGVVLFNSAAASLLPGTSAGGKPTVGASVTPASAPFTVVALEELTFSAQVDEADISRVEPGMPATVLLDGLPDAEFETEVERIEPQAVLTPTGGTAFPVVLRIRTGDAGVLIGMNGSVEIRVETVQDVVTIPIEALAEEGGDDYVFVVTDGVARKVTIEIGRLTDTLVEVRSGVNEGDKVIVSGVGDLVDGDRVKTR